jgi:hypothetical protein
VCVCAIDCFKMAAKRRVALVFDLHPRPILLLLNDSQAEFSVKCNEAARRLFGDDAYCERLEMEPFGMV